MNKLTKIIATIGPSSDSPEMIETLIEKGVNIFRFNFKHNTVEWHSERINRVNSIAEKMGVRIGTLIDLQGPELRINMPHEEIEVAEGELLVFGQKAFEEDKKGFSITHPHIIEYLKEGQQLLADDGAFSFHVVKKGTEVFLQSETSGILKTRKTLNIPGADFPFPVLIERDFEGLKLATRHEIDFIALSFVRSAHDIKVVREEMKKFKVKGKIIAKIETQKALDDLDNIITSTDGIMVARGDLGVEIPIERVPFYQKQMIRKCIEQGKSVITATQMLQTMIDFPYPTRAEISDVANAIYDNTDAIMLSGETANGKYPVKAVEMMNKTALFYEPKVETDLRDIVKYSVSDSTTMMCNSAYNLYRQHLNSDEPIVGFVVFSQSGKTAETLSAYRPKVPIFAFTPTDPICDLLTINFGVTAFEFAYDKADEVKIGEINKAVKMLRDKKYITKEGKVIIIHGDHWGRGSGATTIRVV
ncbi:MAG TPA: pyruvate kinase [Candidatus Woesebacteria bacterium]|nr:pyruvate kinase [Candidatus Woesebacteria bacterium]